MSDGDELKAAFRKAQFRAALAASSSPTDVDQASAAAVLDSPHPGASGFAQDVAKYRTRQAAGGTPYGFHTDDSPKPEGYYLTHAPPPEMVAKEVGEVGIAAANAVPNTLRGLADSGGAMVGSLFGIDPSQTPFAAGGNIPRIPDIPGTEGGVGQEVGATAGGLGVLAATGGVAGVPTAAAVAGLETFGAHYHALRQDGASEVGAVLGALGQSSVDAAAIAVPLGRMAKATEGGLGQAITTGYVFGGVSGAQQVLSDAITAAATPKDMGTLLDWVGRAGESSLKGGLAGLFVGAIHSAFADMTPAKQQKALDSITDRAPVEEPVPPIGEAPAVAPDESQASVAAPVELTPEAGKVGDESASPAIAPAPAEVQPAKVESVPGGAAGSDVPGEGAAPEHGGAAPVRSEESPSPKPGDVSIKNAKMAEDLAALGLEAPQKRETVGHEDTIKAAAATIKDNPGAGRTLIDELVAKPRSIEAEEGAILLHERNRIRLELDEARREKNPERIETAKADLQRLAEAARGAGEKQGRGLNFRQAFMAEDYSYAGIEARMTDAKGEALTEDEAKAAHDLADEMATAAKAEETNRATADREHRLSVLEAKVAEMEKDLARPARARSHRRKAQEARAEIDQMFRELATTAHQLGPQQIVTLTKLAAAHIKLGYHSFEAWRTEVRAQIGDKADEHLEAAWAAAQKERRGEVTERMKARVAEGSKPSDLGRYVDQITRRVVESGVKGRDAVVDAVHESLKEVFPKMTRAEAEDAISGYGKFKPLSKDPVAVEVRGIKGELQQLGKLRDLEAKRPPKKSGPERREPTSAERRLQKKVNALTKELGIRVTDPETQLKSALASRETYTENRIKDLRHEIDILELTADTRVDGPTSPRLEALRAELKKTQAEHEAIFGKKGASDEQKAAAALKATQVSLAEYERRLSTGDLSKPPEPQGPPTAETARLDQERRVVAAKRDAARKQIAALEHFVDTEPRLERQIARIQDMIEQGKVRAKGRPQGPATERVARLEARKAELEKQAAKIRDAQRAKLPQRSPEEIARDNYLARKHDELAHAHERLLYEDFAPRDKKPERALSPAEVEAAVEVKKVKEKIALGERRYQREQWSTAHKRLDDARQVLGAVTDVLTSMDLPPVFRQGGVFTLTHPVLTARAFGRSLSSIASAETVNGALHGDWGEFMSDAGARRIQAAVEAHPDFQRLKDAGTDFTGYGDTLSHQEENVRSTISKNIPGVAHTQRGFVSFMNLQRLLIGEHLLSRAQGGSPKEQARSISRYINDATGRGKLSNPRADAGLELARMGLFAPRLYLSRINLLTGKAFRQATPEVRRIIAKDMGVMLGTVGALSVFAYALGNKDVWDWRSSDALKLRVGDTSIDLTPQLGQYVTLLGQTATGETKSTVTGEVNANKGFFDPVERFAENKVTPPLGLAAELARSFQHKPGRDFKVHTVPEVFANAITPLSPRDVIQTMRAQGVPQGIAMSLAGLLGAGLNTYARGKHPRK